MKSLNRQKQFGQFHFVGITIAIVISVDARQLAITNVDGLDNLAEVQVCTAYRLNGRTLDFMPTDVEDVAQLKPVYETFPGWQMDTSEAKAWTDLPTRARKYLRVISKLIGAKLTIASVGPGRNQTIFV